MSEITEAMVRAAWREAYLQGIQAPFMARSRDYPNLEDLKRADAEADLGNDEAMRAVLRAALDATA